MEKNQTITNNNPSTKGLKRIKEAGIVIQILGWGKIVLPFFIPFIISTDDFLKSFLSYSYSDLAVNICLGIIFVILGSRIHKGPDRNTKKYLWIMVVISVIVVLLNYAINGTHSFSVAILVACIYALWHVGHIQINKEKPNYRISGYKYVGIGLLMLLIIFTGLAIDSILYTLDDINSSEEVSNLVIYRYTNTEHDFSILLPEGWKIGPPTRPSETIVQRAVNGSKNISVMITDLETSKKSVKDFGTAENMANEMVSNAKLSGVSNAQLIDYGETMISDRPAYWVTFSGYHANAGVEYTNIVYSLIKDGNLFNISSLSTPDEFPTYLPIFKEASQSFKFNN